MTNLCTLEMPRTADRPVRIAFIVFNDTYGDTRVLKTAETARRAGAEVRIFALGGNGRRFPEGLEIRSDGVEIERHQLRNFTAFSDFLGRIGRASASAHGGTTPPESPEETLRRPARPADEVQETMPQVPANWVQRQAGSPFSGQIARERREAYGRVIAPLRRTLQGVRRKIRRTRTRTVAPLTRRIRREIRALDRRFNRRVARHSIFAKDIQPLITAWKPDLIHAHDANTLSAAGRAARTLHVPFVYDSHELWTQRNRPKPSVNLRLRESISERYWARRAARVITVSPSIANWLQNQYGLREVPELVRNIPPFSGHLPSREGGRLRELAGLKPTDKVIVYCGGITTNRGIEKSIEAMSALPSDTHFVLLGYTNNSAYEAEVRNLVEQNGVTDRVHFVGKVPSGEVSEALADADVSLVLTQPTCLSYEYSLPNKLFESIHAGIPVLSTHLPDAAALVAEYGVGETVAVDASREALAARVQHVISRSGELRAATVRAASQLTWANEADRLVTVWSRALGVTPRTIDSEAA